MKKYLILLVSFCLLSLTHMPEENKGTIFLSRDRGESWIQSDSGFPTEGSVNAMMLIGKTVVVGTQEHGIYVSEDGLKHWISSNSGLPPKTRIIALALHQNILFAGTGSHGVFVSYNNGSSWESANHGLGNLPIGFVNLTIRCFYSTQSTIFAGTDNAIYSSVDQGKNWKVVKIGNQINAFTSYHGILFAATNQGALRSEDGGKSWTLIYKTTALANIAVDGENLISMTGDNRILLGSDLGRQWAEMNFNFGQYTFRITPASSPLLIAAWKNEFVSLQSFRCDGLPEKTPFTRILVTPYGTIIARSYGFC